MRQFFPMLGEERKQLGKKITWHEPSLLYMDSYTKRCDLEVQKIVRLQAIASQLTEAFTNTK